MEVTIEYINNNNLNEILTNLIHEHTNTPYLIFENINDLLEGNIIEHVLNASFDEEQASENYDRNNEIQFDCEIKYSDHTHSDCEICLEKFNNNLIYTCPSCKGVYHYNCINNWVQRQNSCPKCRCEIKTKQKENDGFEDFVDKNLKL